MPLAMHARMLDLSELLEGIEGGRVVLPDFQRDFDWSEADARALLVTILSGWPAGSFLLMEGSPTFFRIRQFESAPKPSSDIHFVVLDGQQRLTALYQALTGRGPFVYALNYEGLTSNDVDSLEDNLTSFKRGDWDNRHGSLKAQLSEGWLPLYVLASPADFFSWRDDISSLLPEKERQPFVDKLTQLYRNLIGGVHKYDFPAVIVPRTVEPAAIARIFERVNKTGMRLSTFDLMVAISYGAEWNLRDQWEAARRDNYHIDLFLPDDGLAILQAISLRYSKNVRQSAVLELPGKLVREEWDEAVSATELALQFMAEEFSCTESWMVPYRNIIVLLAALARETDLGTRTEALRTWFWHTAFASTYDAASNTRVVADYISILEREKPDSTLLSEPISAVRMLDSTKRRQGAVWRAFLCALGANNARDLGTGDPLWTSSGGERRLEESALVQSLFPRWVNLIDEDTTPPHLRILGLTLALRPTAKSLRNGDWSSVLIGDHATSHSNILESQFMPESLMALNLESEWPIVIEERLRALEGMILEKVGLQVAWDTEV
jgi:hypothetical protein